MPSDEMSKPDVTNLSILASAGTGKTFRLSDRIIQLLSLEGVEPRNIAALTFTRAAAAEFIVKLVQKLQEAATDDKKRLALCERVGIDPRKHDKAWFLRTLRTTLLDSNRMTLGTLDSFFAKLVRCFPLEVGIQTGVAATVSDQDADALRTATLESTLGSLTPRETATLLANLREYADGEKIPNPLETLAKMAKEHHELIVTAPDAARWGNAGVIWPKTRPIWYGYSERDLRDDWEVLRGAIAANHNDAEPKDWPTQLRPLPAIVADAKPSQGDLNTVLEYLGETMSTPMGTASKYPYKQGKPLTAAQSDAARRLLFQAMDKLVNAKLRQTQALHKCLELYERQYDAVNRRQGQLGFSDYVTLLTRAPDFRQDEIAFRLDGEISHWLLDEFQDTSTLQFKVLSKTINDILDSDDADRSVFVVGDLKQSLYEWRSGNRKLLQNLNGKIATHPRGETLPLNETRRCAQPVLDLVNEVLTLREVGPGAFPNYFGQRAATDWAANFQRQESLTEPGQTPKKGESHWYRLEKKPGRPNPSQELADQATWIAKHLESTEGLLDGEGRLRHGLTCAILVSKNDQAAAIAEVLRRNKRKIEASEEAKSTVIEDNPVTAGLAGILRAIVHPDNGLEKGLAEISPAARSVIDALGGWSAAATSITERFHADGAEAAVDLLIRNIRQPEKTAAFVAKRLGQLRNLAVRYDGTGRRALGDFAEFLGRSQMRDNADTRTIQVLTIHRSKGLEYDIVYMPCLNDSRRSIAHLRTGDLLSMPTNEAGMDFSPKWLLANVGEAVAAHDEEVLRHAMERAKAEAAYGSLCKLYVGTTRARHRLVMLSMTLSKEKASQVQDPDGRHDFATLLESQLGRAKLTAKPASYEGCNPCSLLWESQSNDPTWLQERIQAQASTHPTIPGGRPARTYAPFESLEVIRPSKKNGAPSLGRHVFTPARQTKIDPRELGNAVHALLEHLESDIAAFKASLPSLPLPPELRHAHAEATEIVLACVDSKPFRELIGSLTTTGVLWREREMAVVTEPGKYAYGKSDRIHVEPGKSAVVIDYKTVSIETTEAELAAEYKDQLNIYRVATAKLCRLHLDKVRCVLVHVRKGTVVEVEPEAAG